MNWMMNGRGLSLGLLVTAAIGLAGCNKDDVVTEPGTADPVAATNVDHSHGGWWCVEHGVPEEECPRCDKTLVSEFKEAGDWCDEHDRPESQCFICSPKRAEKFVARYEAKTGHQPPEPTE
ncbi:RND transporter [Rhodopirellula bahusiensis]|uniref:RND transporter n=1 Tax=Rhodopirellula bahusiensis TaxID=2014065 RepID=A0A2G1VZA2_9BACT|nr:RND transporter [Rhodopirellula bahusiensis]PHQ32061.1 RND transporter [Rhodopirellula bahusiensis]